MDVKFATVVKSEVKDGVTYVLVKDVNGTRRVTYFNSMQVKAIPKKKDRLLVITTDDRYSIALASGETIEKVEVGEYKIQSVFEGEVNSFIHLKKDEIEIFDNVNKVVLFTKFIKAIIDLRTKYNNISTQFNTLLTSYKTHLHPTPNGPSGAPAVPTTAGNTEQSTMEFFKP